MKKQMNNSKLHRWTAFLLVFVLVSGIFTSPVKVYANPYGGGDGNCTYTAWRLAYANTGIQLPGWGNAHTWYDSARNAGFTVSTVPRAKSIAVWKGGPSGYGHVAYVTEVSGDQIYIQEGGYNGAYHEGWENAYGQTKYYSSNLLTMIGYIYLGDTSKEDLGESFYAFITNAYCNLDVTAIDGDIKLKKEIGTGNQVFQFTRLSDGYYQILECASKNSMNVYNASSENRTNVGTYTPDNSSAQKWYITGNDTYTIHAACTSCVLSAAWGATSDGASVNMETDGQGNWQRWYIRKLPSVGRTTVQVQVDQEKATFTWSEASACSSYSLRIFKDNKDFHSEYGLKVLSKTVELEPGSYTAYIDSCNAYSYLNSNKVSFTIAETANDTEKEHTLVTIPRKEATCTQSGWTQGEYCSVCGKIFVEQKEIPKTGHRGGTATCIAAAVCDICHMQYGDINLENHEGNTVIKDAKKATETTEGYTGDTYCTSCNKKIKSGTKIAKISTIPEVFCNATVTWNGKAQKPVVTVKNSDGVKISSSNYTVKYSNNKNVGQATAIITFKNGYIGTVKKTFMIVPKGTTLSKVTAKSKGFTAKWKEQSTQTDGYEIQYATASNFKGSKTAGNIKSKITSKKITKLKANKKYYVRIRTYKTAKVDGKNKKLYSNWSKVKKVVVKK